MRHRVRPAIGSVILATLTFFGSCALTDPSVYPSRSGAYFGTPAPPARAARPAAQPEVVVPAAAPADAPVDAPPDGPAESAAQPQPVAPEADSTAPAAPPAAASAAAPPPEPAPPSEPAPAAPAAEAAPTPARAPQPTWQVPTARPSAPAAAVTPPPQPPPPPLPPPTPTIRQTMPPPVPPRTGPITLSSIAALMPQGEIRVLWALSDAQVYIFIGHSYTLEEMYAFVERYTMQYPLYVLFAEDLRGRYAAHVLVLTQQESIRAAIAEARRRGYEHATVVSTVEEVLAVARSVEQSRLRSPSR